MPSKETKYSAEDNHEGYRLDKYQINSERDRRFRCSWCKHGQYMTPLISYNECMLNYMFCSQACMYAKKDSMGNVNGFHWEKKIYGKKPAIRVKRTVEDDVYDAQEYYGDEYDDDGWITV